MRFPAGTYDELQIPQGSWAELHKQQNRLYNTYFMISAAIATVLFAAVRLILFPNVLGILCL